MNPSHYLVTGAAGFIGFHLTLHLLSIGAKVTAIDNFSPYYDPSLKKLRASKLLEAGANFLPLSIEEFLKTKPDPANFNAIFHLAGQPGARHKIAQDHLTQNVGMTLALLEWGSLPGNLDFFLASSSSVYGNFTGEPSEETMSADLPLHPYGASKRSAELFLAAFAPRFKKAFAFRFFNVYGAFGRPDNFYYIAADKILNNQPITLFGQNLKRDMTYIDDLILALEGARSSPLLGYEIFNLCGSKPESIEGMVAIIEELLGKKASLKFTAVTSEASTSFGSNQKARNLLGFNPKTSLKEGLTTFIDWFLLSQAPALR